MTLEELLNLVAAQTGAVVNIQILDATFYEIASLKVGPRHHYHHGSYCHFAKVHGNQDACHANKQRSLRRAQQAQPFHGCCPFGVWDYAHPVHIGGRCLAVLYLGHFGTDQPLAAINNQPYTGHALPPITAQRLSEIKQHARFIHQFITYAYENARRLGSGSRKQMPASHYQRICDQFIQDHYHQPIRLVDLAELLDVNPNYLGQVIKTHCGRSFRQLLNQYRINQAMISLGSEDLPITTIAYVCGFQDSNYFTYTFHKWVGQTPTQYRQQARSTSADAPRPPLPHADAEPGRS